MEPVSDPDLLAKLNAGGGDEKPVTDPALLAKLDGKEKFDGRRPEAPAEILMTAAKNVPASAAHFARDIVQPVIHPIETGLNLSKIGLGVMEKLGLKKETQNTQAADAVGKFLVDRYGGMDAIRKTLETDPVGLAADVSMVLTGGGSAAARAPGVVGRVGEVAAAAGRAVDPLVAAGKGIDLAGKGAAGLIGNLGTHTGGKSLTTAAQAGYEGGEAARVFQENMRGGAEPGAVVRDARKAVSQIRKERSGEYKTGMADVAADKNVVDWAKIDDALIDASNVQTFKGQDLSPTTQATRQGMAQAIQDWRRLDPAEFHTPEGMDALKRKLGELKDATPEGPERVTATKIYDGVRQSIIDEFPQYAKVMKGYEEASVAIKELEKSLSLGRSATTDTALRKLQSVLRNNVNTNYGQRQKLVEYLTEHGSPQLMEALAGQALNSWYPRGLGKLVGTEIAAASAGAFGGAGIAGAGAGAALALPLMSPRLMGEAAYYTGKAAAAVEPYARPVGNAAFQLGRAARTPLAPDSPLAGGEVNR